MNIGYFTTRMATNAGAVNQFVKHVDIGQAQWKPSAEKWSMIEVMCHLYDEERLDFRRRLELVLEDPTASWPPIDPQGWVSERNYAAQDIVEMRTLFEIERERSIAWLSGLQDPDLEAVHEHPQIGRLSAGSLLASWLAHDYLHIRQLAGLHYGYLAGIAEPHSLSYAGPW